MGVGKYSPTVSASYGRDQNWWKRNGGDFGNGRDPKSDLDDDGYDSYGYGRCGDRDGPDRAGITEERYANGDDDGNGGWHYPLYDKVDAEWADRLLGDLAPAAA